MSADLFRRIVRELRAAGVDQLGLFYMSEPFVVAGLADAIRWAKEEAGVPYVFLTTNGVAAGEREVRACIEAGLNSLKFALNFSDPQQWRSAGSVDAGVDAVIENVRLARRVRDEVRERTGHACRLSASSLEFDANQHGRMEPLLRAVSESVDEHYWLPLLGRRGLAPVDMPDRERSQIGRKALPCWPLFSEAHVRADGCLSACCLDASDRFVVGDLNSMDFQSAWHSETFRALRQAHLRGDVGSTACEQCIAFK